VFDKPSGYSEHGAMSTSIRLTIFTCSACLALVAQIATADKQLLWGDTHLHTSYSADSYLDGNFTVDPETAYRYALGQPVIHPFHRARVQIDTPLDFLVVSDHAEFLGGIRQVHQNGVDTTGMGPGDKLIAWLAEKMFEYILADGNGMDFFKSFTATPMDPRKDAAQLYSEEAPSIPGQEQIVASAWREEVQIADTYNRPGEFSAIIGWEWTSAPGGANLHRVIFTDGDAASAALYIPFSRDESPYPEDLWHWLEQTAAATGDQFVSIPHNSNVSKGFMFPLETLRGKPFTREYLKLRNKWEPVVEATQTKGDSEAHPLLSPEDTFANFERYIFYIQAYPTPYKPEDGDFVRSALKRGLSLARDSGINPYQFGMIGSTDSHTGLSSPEERNFQGEQPEDSIPENKTRGISGGEGPTGWDMSASGRAAVWAEDNTREAILQAFQRREVYATTGPRIAVRFDGGWYPPDDVPAEEDQIAITLHASQLQSPVPMGSELSSPSEAGQVPGFSITAMKDPGGANLDRIQIIKGWLDHTGESHERIFDVAWSGPRKPNRNGIVPPVGNTVDIATASYDNTIGAPALNVTWQDPQFDPAQSAFYYARVLEIPTPRHSLYDAVSLNQKPGNAWPATLQERAYTSPIWYQPSPTP
jgi:hypothetical protein